jgi:DNA (cytosine-5)-methyltransferase 1
MNYYNEHDPKAAAWLRELIAQGHIPRGDVDTRSIIDVKPHEIAHYTQQHFFAGISGWSLALRLAGWPDTRPVRTGSCPCQPFSQAGKGKGSTDERHLWPVFRDIITFGDPTITFGEQVASKAGREWLSGVRVDLEGLGYAFGAADLCAACVGSPHIRQRLFWVANPSSQRRSARRGATPPTQSTHPCRDESEPNGFAGGVEHPDLSGCSKQRGPFAVSSAHIASELPSGVSRMGHTYRTRRQSWQSSTTSSRHGHSTIPASHWDDFDIIPCADGKSRRVESGTFPLAHGVSGRVGMLRGYSNAIVPQVAAQFILACKEALTTAH